MSTPAAAPESRAMMIALLICGMTAQSIAAQAPDAESGSGSNIEPARLVSYLPQLRANTSNSVRYVVKDVCEREGVRQIARILRRSEFEEMWVFLPRAGGTGHCEWHEIGREERSDRDGARLRVDMEYLERLMAANEELHVYHFHPLKYFECASHPDCSGAAAPGGAELFDRRWISDVVFSMPSPSDVHFMMDVTSRFRGSHHRVGTIRHKIVTPYGVVSFGLTDAGLAWFETERFGRSEGLYVTWVAASRLSEDHVEEVIKERPGSIMGAVRRLAQTLNSQYLWVLHGTPAHEEGVPGAE